jgi:hypothetical protein
MFDFFGSSDTQNTSLKEGRVLALGVNDTFSCTPVSENFAFLEVAFMVGITFFPPFLF